MREDRQGDARDEAVSCGSCDPCLAAALSGLSMEEIMSICQNS